jgi:hypothetical protein
MSELQKTTEKISSGEASRFLKKRWILPNNQISTEAFDLRLGPPPEDHISHFLVAGEGNENLFRAAYAIISEKIPSCANGGIALLDISATLTEVNDDEQLISFIEAGFRPHCGLIYTTNEQSKILEAKTTLSFLAARRKTLISRLKTTSNQLA